MNFFSISKKIDALLKKDSKFKKGKIIGSMCSHPEKIAKKFFIKNIEKNIGDPGLVPGTDTIEKLSIEFISKFLNSKNGEGVFTTGGSEANILALLTAKLMNPMKDEVIISEDAHFSFDKAAVLMNLKLIKIDIDKNFEIDIAKVKKAVSGKTLAIVGIAGTTGIGAIDNIKELNNIALEKNIYLHIDAAFGGFVIPFLKAAGYDTKEFDFSLDGVKSITIDPHKMGKGIIPGGAIIYKNRDVAKMTEINVKYLAGGATKNRTITGTRNGASIIANYATFLKTGVNGYIDNVKICMENTFYLYKKLLEIDNITILKYPEINIIAIKHKFYSIEIFAELIKNKNWKISIFKNYIRIVVMPHITKNIINNFIKDLRRIK